MIVSEKEITTIELDPFHELADADKSNNMWPSVAKKSRLEMFMTPSSQTSRMKAFDVSAMGKKTDKKK